MNLNSPICLPCGVKIERLVGQGAKFYSLHSLSVEVSRQLISIKPWGPHELKRHCVTHPLVCRSQLAQQSGHHIEHRRPGMGNVRGRRNPGESGVVPPHLPLPTVQRNDREFAFSSAAQPSFSVDHLSQFSGGHSVHIGYRVHADKRLEAKIEHCPLDPASC